MKRNKGKLTANEYLAVDMLARGLSEQTVADACGHTKNWVALLKNRDGFQEAFDEATERIVAIMREKTNEHVVDDLETFRTRFKEGSELVFNASFAFLEKIQEAILQLDPADIGASKIASNLKAACESISMGMEMRQASLGLNEINKQIDELKELREARRDRTSQNESNLEELEAS